MESKALDVARYLIKLAGQEAEPELMSNMRIQKLLYYIQGWHLACYGCPFFDDKIEAWKHGPVCRGVWSELNDLGDRAIRPDDIRDPQNLGRDDKDIIRSVWEAYKKYSASELRRMTHAERPWITTRGELPEDAPCDKEIDPQLIANFFADEASTKMLPSLTPERIREAEGNLKKGRWTTLAELRKKIA